MSAADAQRPASPRTNPTGHLTLVRAGCPIDPSTYFREEFFGDAGWQRVGRDREQAHVVMDVTVDGRPLGRHRFVIDHNPYFESGQNNRTTTLRWGDDMNDYFRRNNLVRKYVTLEKYGDGSYRLTVSDTATGSFAR
jgi:hypothetical protein